MASLDSSQSPQSRPFVWFVAGVLALSYFGLIHDIAYLGSARGTAESDENIANEEAFQKSVDAAPLGRKLGFVGMVVVGAVCFCTPARGVRVHWGVLTVLASLTLAWACVSYLWSADRHETMRELVRLLAYAGVGLGLARRFNVTENCFIVVVVLFASVVVAVGLEAGFGFFRPWEPDFRLRGTLHANTLSRHALLVAVAGLICWRDDRFGDWYKVITIAMIAVLLLTKSRTGLVTFLACILAVRLVATSASQLCYLGCILLAAAGGALFLATLGGPWLQRQTREAINLGRDDDVTSLSGRLALWQSIWNEAGQRKLTGFGYGAFWLPAKTEDVGAELKWYPRHAHSAYVELLVNVGLVGLALSLCTVLAAVGRAAHMAVVTGMPEFRFLTALFAAGLVNGVAEAAFVLPRDLGLVVATGLGALIVIHPTTAARVAVRLGGLRQELPRTAESTGRWEHSSSSPLIQRRLFPGS